MVYCKLSFVNFLVLLMTAEICQDTNSNKEMLAESLKTPHFSEVPSPWKTMGFLGKHWKLKSEVFPRFPTVRFQIFELPTLGNNIGCQIGKFPRSSKLEKSYIGNSVHLLPWKGCWINPVIPIPQSEQFCQLRFCMSQNQG